MYESWPIISQTDDGNPDQTTRVVATIRKGPSFTRHGEVRTPFFRSVASQLVTYEAGLIYGIEAVALQPSLFLEGPL